MIVLVACAILLVFYLMYFLVSEYLASRFLPPGPFPLPIIGNLHLLSSKPYLDFSRISEKYGPVYRLQMGWNRMIVINSYQYAKEAMMKKGTDFAGRPPHHVGSIFSRNGKGVGFQTHSEMVKLQRKVIIKTLKELDRKTELEEIVSTETRGLVCRIGSIGTFSETSTIHVDSTFAMSNIVASVIFGERFSEGDPEFLKLMDAITVLRECLAATSFLDTFPFLKYFPFEIIDRVKGACAERDTMLEKKFREQKKVYEKGGKTYTSRNLTNALLVEAATGTSQGKLDMEDDHILMTMNDALLAGSETPATNLVWVLYYLIKYPNVQKRIQRELDEVIGRNRAPKWSERQDLPYLQGFLAETLRCSSAMPFAIPHQTIKNTCLGPYQIPEGTTVIMNLWAIHRDSEMWENPLEFKPERFLNENGKFNIERGAGILAFGLGHRSCPGETLAKMEAFLATSQMLQKFNFRQVEGDVLPEPTEGSFGLVMRPAPFNVCISQRN